MEQEQEQLQSTGQAQSRIEQTQVVKKSIYDTIRRLTIYIFLPPFCCLNFKNKRKTILFHLACDVIT
jgi:hypothetical protein